MAGCLVATIVRVIHQDDRQGRSAVDLAIEECAGQVVIEALKKALGEGAAAGGGDIAASDPPQSPAPVALPKPQPCTFILGDERMGEHIAEATGEEQLENSDRLKVSSVGYLV